MICVVPLCLYIMELFLLCLVLLLPPGLSTPDSVTSTVGDDCDLPCSGPQGELLVLEWIKDDRYLLLYRDDKIEKTQDQSFRGRVHLTDPELRRGEMTVTLKDLTLEDTGTYVCDGLVQTSGGKEERFTREIHLSVSERTRGKTEAQKDDVTEAANGKNVSLILGVTFPLIIVAITLSYWKRNAIKDLVQKLKKLFRASTASDQSVQEVLKV